MTSNSMMVIFPYKIEKTWFFDDEATGLKKEAFVSGMSEIIDTVVNEYLGEGVKKFALVFSASLFPGNQVCLDWVREEHGGNWYRYYEVQGWNRIKEHEGWLCPALFKYFETAPENIFAQVKPLS